MENRGLGDMEWARALSVAASLAVLIRMAPGNLPAPAARHAEEFHLRRTRRGLTMDAVRAASTMSSSG